MTGIPWFGRRRLTVGLLVLAALLHVQWLAACETMPVVDGAVTCCAGREAEPASTCEKRTGAHECVTPFAKSTATLKLPERADDADTTPGQLLASIPGMAVDPPVRTSNPLGRQWPVHLPNGRFLYLSSSRLRL